MERRVLLAISLSFLVLFLYQAFVMPPAPPDTAGNASVQQASAGSPPSGNGRRQPVRRSPAPPPVAEAAVVGESTERDVIIETQKVRAVFTNRGARLKHWVLKDYKDDSGQPLDLVPGVGDRLCRSRCGWTIAAATARLNDALYRVSGASGTAVDAHGAERHADLRRRNSPTDCARARCSRSSPQSYIVHGHATSVQQGTRDAEPHRRVGAGTGRRHRADAAGLVPLAELHLQGAGDPPRRRHRRARRRRRRLATGLVREGQFRWVGIDDHYFISAVLQPPVAGCGSSIATT